ncbi:hypothetical protein COT87_01340, partial [Candidatus Collierbacteria bacterium CG10_big_fil_rev_8_21_14_0_10_44_9]
MKQKILLFLTITLPLTAGLISLQIFAPIQLKPLTNHLLEYPGALPTLKSQQKIILSKISSKTRTIKFLPHTPQVAILTWKQWNEKRVEREKRIEAKQAAHPNQTAGGGYAGGGTGPNSNLGKALSAQNAGKRLTPAQQLEIDKYNASLKVSAKVATNANAQTQSAAYIAQYGNEIGRFGYVYPDGSVAGTYKADDGTLRVLAIGDTQNAYNQNNQIVKNQVANMTDAQIKTAGGINKILTDSAVFDPKVQQEIIGIQQANQELQAKIITFLDPNSSREKILNCAVGDTSCREMTYEDYLKKLGVDELKIPDLLSDRQTNINNQAKLKVFYDP